MPATGRDSTGDNSAKEATIAKRKKKDQTALTRDSGVALKKQGGQVDWNTALVNLVITILGGYMLILLAPSGDAHQAPSQAMPRLMYAQH